MPHFPALWRSRLLAALSEVSCHGRMRSPKFLMNETRWRAGGCWQLFLQREDSYLHPFGILPLSWFLLSHRFIARLTHSLLVESPIHTGVRRRRRRRERRIRAKSTTWDPQLESSKEREGGGGWYQDGKKENTTAGYFYGHSRTLGIIIVQNRHLTDGCVRKVGLRSFQFIPKSLISAVALCQVGLAHGTLEPFSGSLPLNRSSPLDLLAGLGLSRPSFPLPLSHAYEEAYSDCTSLVVSCDKLEQRKA